MAVPFLRAGSQNDLVRNKYTADTLVFSDEFTTGTAPNPQKWKYNRRKEFQPGTLGGQYKFDAALARTGVASGMRRDGSYDPNDSEEAFGKRFAGWQDDYREICHQVKGNQLHMGSYLSNDIDPTCPDTHPVTGETVHPYLDPRSGRQVDLRRKVFVSWLDSAGVARYNDPSYGEFPYADPDSPMHAWKYGYFEMDMDFRQMNTPGFRQSAWLMPFVDPLASKPYQYTLVDPNNPGSVSVAGDGIAATGCEIDLFEYDPSPSGMQTLFMKVPLVGGPEWGFQNVYADDWGYLDENGLPFVFDVRRGYITIGLEWNPDYLGYYVNGIEVNRDYHRVPHVGQYMLLTREFIAAAGIPGSAPAIDPYRPDYTGAGYLFGDNAGAYTDRINTDACIFNYVRAWQNPTVPNVWRALDNQANAVDPSTPTGNVSRYINAPAHGVRFGAPIRTRPNLDRNDIPVQAITINVTTSTDDDWNLTYSNGTLRWNAQGRTQWDIFKFEPDNLNGRSYYGSASNTPEFTVTESGIYNVYATDIPGQNINSDRIHIISGLDSIDASGVTIDPGGDNTGEPPPDVDPPPVLDGDDLLLRRSRGYLEAPQEVVAFQSFNITAQLPDNEDGTPANPDDFTYQWTIPAGFTVEGADDAYVITVYPDSDILEGERITSFPTCNITPKSGVVEFTATARIEFR